MQSFVSVIMPVYNAEKYVALALQSVLDQTYTNFELLIYDDASTDNTINIIQSFNDNRIKIIYKDKNTGYTNSLIQGVQLAKGKYLARMDGDDIMSPDRLKLQVEFLEANADYGIVGSFAETIAEGKENQIWKYPIDDLDIKSYLISNSPFVHPLVMFRKCLLTDHNINYDPAYEPCEDYKLWFELLKITKGKNLPCPLLKYRLHNTQTIAVKRELLIKNSNQIRKEIFNHEFGVELNNEELDLNYSYFNEVKASNIDDIRRHAYWKNKLLSITKNSPLQKSYRSLIQKLWLIHLQTLTEFRPFCLTYLFDLSVLRNMSLKNKIFFFIKSLMYYRVKSAHE